MARACGTTNQYPVARGTASEESVSFSSQQACERQEFLSYVQLGTFMYEYGACGISLRNYSTASPSRLVDAMVQFEYNSHHHTMHAPSSTFWKRIHHNYHKLLLTIQHGAASSVRSTTIYPNPIRPRRRTISDLNVLTTPATGPLGIPVESCPKITHGDN